MLARSEMPKMRALAGGRRIKITRQFALFSVMPNPARHIYDWLAQFPKLCRKIIVPPRLKRKVRDKLDQANITERVLFPELDGLTQWLKRHYTKLA